MSDMTKTETCHCFVACATTHQRRMWAHNTLRSWRRDIKDWVLDRREHEPPLGPATQAVWSLMGRCCTAEQREEAGAVYQDVIEVIEHGHKPGDFPRAVQAAPALRGDQ